MTEKQFRANMQITIEKVRAENPMAPSITNTVTQDFVANAQLAIGGSAAMIYMPDEGETMAKISRALYINLGTVMPFYAETIPRTLRALQENKKPFVFDPVGIGFGNLRTELLMQMKQFQPKIIRGNASEIISLSKLWNLHEEEGGEVRGVDSTEDVDKATPSAVALAKFTKGTVAVSGEKDLITDGQVLVYSLGGSPLFSKITGSGCALGGVMAIYLTVASPIIAAFTAAAMFNCAGTRAAQTASTPASFKVNFLDELFRISAADVAASDFAVFNAE